MSERPGGKKEVQLPERKKYVKYTQNYKSRAIVDFDSGEILVETLDDQDPSTQSQECRDHDDPDPARSPIGRFVFR